jgi:apolipoprotein N-acyltransferase
MVCQSCGYSAAEGAFCSRCGAPVQAAPPNAAPNPNQNPVPMYGVPPGVPGMPPPIGYHPAYQPRVERHVQTLGILWCVYGGYRALGGIVAAAILMGLSIPGFFGDWGGMHGSPFPFMPHFPFMGVLGVFVAVVTLTFAALSFLVGFSLLNRKPWGRVLAMVVAILQLIKIPVGTALGVYTLWVLGPSASAAEYDAIADRT